MPDPTTSGLAVTGCVRSIPGVCCASARAASTRRNQAAQVTAAEESQEKDRERASGEKGDSGSV